MEVRNKIYESDCLSGLRKLPDNCVDIVITDPDYGVGINYESTITSKKVRRKTIKEIESELIPVLKECYRVSKRDLCFFWSGSWERIHDFIHIVKKAKLKIKHLGIWYKPNGAGATGNGLGRRFETWFWIEGKSKRQSEWGRYPDVIKVNRVTQRSKEGVLHPSQKPIDLMKILIRFFSKEGDIILDPYMGSGSTALACILLNRCYCGFEINPEYIQIINNRIERAKTQTQNSLREFCPTEIIIIAKPQSNPTDLTLDEPPSESLRVPIGVF